MSLRSPLSRVLGLGSAREGTEHWWWQRVTAIALVPLGIWFVYCVINLLSSGHAAAVDWLASPVQAGLFILFVLVSFWHSVLGLRVVVEDYVHTEWLKVATILAINLVTTALAVITVLMVLQISARG